MNGNGGAVHVDSVLIAIAMFGHKPGANAQADASIASARNALDQLDKSESFYRNECAIYRAKIDNLMAEITEAEDEGRGFISTATITAIVTGESQEPSE